MTALHHLVEEQVERSPHAVAIVAGDETLTYEQLNQRANQLAHCLIAVGVRRDTPVAVCLTRRSPAIVAALLGILKAGGAYVPLDPSYPRERLAYTLAASRARIVVIEPDVAPDVPLEEQHTAVDLHATRDTGLAASNPGVCVHDRQLAYILFTSGSTGRPKGVALEHRSA